jgi:hypothetical protein
MKPGLQALHTMKKELEMERRTGGETDPWNNDRIHVHIHLVERVEQFNDEVSLLTGD